jgi:hypothetical protein
MADAWLADAGLADAWLADAGLADAWLADAWLAGESAVVSPAASEIDTAAKPIRRAVLAVAVMKKPRMGKYRFLRQFSQLARRSELPVSIDRPSAARAGLANLYYGQAHAKATSVSYMAQRESRVTIMRP